MASYLVVDQGTPFEKGAFVAVNESMILGRKVNGWKPDLSFDNIFVSRKHVEIYQEDGSYFIKDLGSKHGTQLNAKALLAHQKVELKDHDRITLSDHSIKLSFHCSVSENTSDLTPIETLRSSDEKITLDSIKQQLTMQGQSFVFSEKEYACLELLIEKREQFVPIENIKKYVWKERIYEEDQIPDVSAVEVNTLIYRIRKKTEGFLVIENLRGKGFSLSYEGV